MRAVQGLAIGALLVGATACSKATDEEADGFTPPTIPTRADFQMRLDKRFARMDRNDDGAIQTDELPRRRPERIAAFDADKNGEVTRGEYDAGSIARFDNADANHDGSVTSEERKAIGSRGR